MLRTTTAFQVLRMRAELKRLLQAKTTAVYVTHDQIEALSMGDRTAVMRDGRILQVDTPMMVYEHPADVFVAAVHRHPAHECAARQDG